MRRTQSTAWQALTRHHAKISATHMREQFAADPGRAQRYSLEACGLYLDYSKNRIDDTTLALLFDLAREAELPRHVEAMFSGERINHTENRAVLHTALRNRVNTPVRVDGTDVMPEVNQVLEHAFAFAERVRNGSWKGHTGEAITDVVNIGIGGSDLGPRLVCEALAPFGHERLRLHFASNVDNIELTDILARLNPRTTLFIVASKTFTTPETLANARTAREWLVTNLKDATAVANHFVAVSTNAHAVSEFGIDTRQMFGFWDWVGGRYSLWSAIGLPIMLAIGPTGFKDLLAGAHALDTHFRTAPPQRNLPVILGLISVWYTDFFGAATQVVTPYNQRLRHLPAYLQQLVMESNGKSVHRGGETVDFSTSPVIWGSSGNNGQHAYFQMLHQGTQLVPIDFILAVNETGALPGHRRTLLANMLAQGEAFMRGKTADEVRSEFAAKGITGDTAEKLVPHKVFSGNRPSNTLLLDRLDPTTLGALIALYEHRTFVEGVIWDINPFDQWGVELGKQLAQRIEPELAAGATLSGHDSSTTQLIERARTLGNL